ncbi:MAG: mercuric ion transport protein [Bacteroidia bacterium]|jgi:mercuric ion transport protein
MKSGNKYIGAGVLTAIASSLCCITPLLALVAGTGSFATAFSWLEPLRPYLICFTVLVLGFAWYQKLKVKKEMDCDCEEDEKQSFLQGKTFLGIVTVFAILMLAFPVYSKIFYPNNEKGQSVIDRSNAQTIEYSIAGMTCESCQNTIEFKVNTIQGVFDSKASYKHEHATVSFDTTITNSAEIEEAVNALGYTVTSKKYE